MNQFTGGGHPFIITVQVRSLHQTRFTGRSRLLLRAAGYVSFVLDPQVGIGCACSACQRISRFQQISASFRAAATRAILALERLEIRR